MDGPTALAVLGLGPCATASEISRAFRELAKRTHPDHQGCAAAFHRLRTARDVALGSAAPAVSAAPVIAAAPAAPDATGPWLTGRPHRRPAFDRVDSPRRVSTPPSSPTRTDPTGLRFVDHLTHALAS